MEYAAKDAIVGVQIYRALLHHKLSCVSARRGLEVSQHLNRDDVEMRGTALWQGLVDVTFKRQGKQNGKIQFGEDVNDLVYQVIKKYYNKVENDVQVIIMRPLIDDKFAFVIYFNKSSHMKVNLEWYIFLLIILIWVISKI